MNDSQAQAARITAEASERTAVAGADIFDNATNAVARIWSSGFETASQLIEQSTEEMARAMGLSDDKAQQAAEQTSRNVDAILQTSKSFAQEFHNIAREMTDFNGGNLGRHVKKMQAVVCSRTPQQLLAAQSELLRHDIEAMLESSKRIAAVSMRIADDAARRMTESAGELRKAA